MDLNTKKAHFKKQQSKFTSSISPERNRGSTPLDRSFGAMNTANTPLAKFRCANEANLNLSRGSLKRCSSKNISQGFNRSMSQIKRLSTQNNLRHTKLLEKNLQKSKIQNGKKRSNKSSKVTLGERVSSYKTITASRQVNFLQTVKLNSHKSIRTQSTKDTKGTVINHLPQGKE